MTGRRRLPFAQSSPPFSIWLSQVRWDSVPRSRWSLGGHCRLKRSVPWGSCARGTAHPAPPTNCASANAACESSSYAVDLPRTTWSRHPDHIHSALSVRGVLCMFSRSRQQLVFGRGFPIEFVPGSESQLSCSLRPSVLPWTAAGSLLIPQMHLHPSFRRYMPHVSLRRGRGRQVKSRVSATAVCEENGIGGRGLGKIARHRHREAGGSRYLGPGGRCGKPRALSIRRNGLGFNGHSEEYIKFSML